MNTQPELIMLIGLAGAGKTTYANTRFPHYIIHSSDQIRKELYGDENCQHDHQRVFRILHDRIKKDLKHGRNCVFDATNIRRKNRLAFLKDIENIDCRKVAKIILTPFKKCLENNRRRDRSIPDLTIDKMLKQFQIPGYYEGWDHIDVETTIDDLTDNEFPILWRSTIISSYFPLDNKHHKRDLFDHLWVTKNIIVKTLGVTTNPVITNPVVQAGYCHDIGMPYTKSFTISGRIDGNAHYYGHENVGTYMYLEEAFDPQNMAVVKSDLQVYIANLINWHMRPFVWDVNENVKEKDRILLGEKMFNDLIVLHEADKKAG